MHKGTTEKPRLGYAGGGKIQCMADGGLISKLFGSGKTETVTEKYERQDAERAAKTPKAATTASPPTVPPASSGGSLNPANALKQREAAAGLAKGGKVPGQSPTDTADNIPIMATAGEFMIKKAAVDKLGIPTLEALNAVADGEAKPKLGQVKRKRRGKRKGYAMGGPILFDEYRNPRPASGQPAVSTAVPQTPNAPAPYVNHRAPSGQPVMQPPLALPNNAPPPGSAVSATPYKPNFTMGGTPPAAAPVDGVTDVRPKYNPATGSPEAKAWQASRAGAAPPNTAAPAAAAPAAAGAPQAPQSRLGRIVRTAGNSVGPIGVSLAAIPEALDTATVAMNPDSTGIDVATQAAQGLGRLGSAGVGAKAGAALGAMTGPLAPIAVPLGALAGGALGYYGANEVIQQGRKAAGTDPRAPVDRLAAPAAEAPYPETAGNRQLPPGLPVATQPFSADPRTLTNPNAPATGFVTPAQVVRTGNSYSGAPGISGDIQIVDQGGTPRRMGGSVSTVPANGGGTGAVPSSSSDAALFEARKAAILRGDVDSVKASYGGNFGPKVDPIDALINNGRPMTARKAAAIAQLQAAKAQAEGGATDRKLAADKFALDKEGVDLSNREKKGLLSAQDAYANAKTPAERVAAEERLRALQGKYEKAPPDEYAGIAGGQDANGNRTDPLIYSKRTGQVANAAPALPAGLKVGAPSKQADGVYPNTGGTGKTVTIKGGKVTEIK